MQKTCIIVPCYNEAERLDLLAFKSFISGAKNIDFLFVNDGSRDKTLDLLEKFCAGVPERSKVLHLQKNVGKAEAVRQGVLAAARNSEYAFIGFWDADLATPLSEVINFLNYLKSKNLNVAIGSRMKRLGATVERKTSRHILGRIFSTFASTILKMPVYDTQCGAKLFTKQQATLFEQTFITRWLFDIEILARFRNKHGLEQSLNDIVEVPVNEWIEKKGSKLKLVHMLKVPLELFNIHKKYN